MAEQHYYTRERRGLFRSAEGYDSIAKSSGLTDSFIKKYLQPFCFYDPPRKLDEMREKDTSKYPETFMAYSIESGEMVLGKSVYKSADFTGLRSAFFTHQFVLDRTEKENYIRETDRVAAAGGFADSYNIENGKSLNPVDEIRYDTSVKRSENAYAILNTLGIDENTYLMLLYASIMSVNGKRKIYAALNSDTSDISKCARALISIILKGLPMEVRRNFGFITYSREPESRKYINFTFVEPEALKNRDPKTDRDYIFDFANNRFPDIEAETDSHPYIKYVCSQMGNLRTLDRLFQFSEEILKGMRQEHALSIAAYDELSVLYRVFEGNNELYESSRDSVMKIVMKYGDASNIKDKTKLNRLLHMLIEKERNDTTLKSYIPESSMIEIFIKLYQYKIEDVNANIHYTILLAIGKYNKVRQYDSICNILSAISVNKDMFAMIIEAVMQSIQMFDAFKFYLNKRFNKIFRFSELTSEIEYWDNNVKLVLFSRQFVYFFRDKVKEILSNSSDKIETGNMMYDIIASFIRKHAAETIKYKESFSGTLVEIDDYVFNSIDLESISKEDILKLDLKIKRNDIKYEILEYLRAFLNDEYRFAGDDGGIIEKGSGELVRHLIRSLLKDDICQKNYIKIIQGFRNPFGPVDYDYDGLLEYIRSNKDKQEVYTFIKWSFDNNIFSHSDSMDEYKECVKSYFINYDSTAFKDRKVKKLLHGTKDKDLKELLKETEFELSNPFMKFVIINRRKITLGAMILVFLLVLSLVSVSIINNLHEKKIAKGTAELIGTTAEYIEKNNDSLLSNYGYMVDGSITFKDSRRKNINIVIESTENQSIKTADDSNILKNLKYVKVTFHGCTAAYNISLVKKSDILQDDSENQSKLLEAIEKDVNEKLDNFIKDYFGKYY